jgi:hypothetical protein
MSPFQILPLALEQAFRDGWTDNADVCSYLYTGTPALKTDFTRTGKRSAAGAMWDGINSVTRYYINNFTDGYYHDCLDLATTRISHKITLRKREFSGSIQFSMIMVFLTTLFMSLFISYDVLPAQETMPEGKHTQK